MKLSSFKHGVMAVAIMIVAAVAASAADKSLEQAKALLGKMTLDEKIGQMTQVDLLALKDKSDVGKYFLGSMLSGGGSDPKDNQAATWRKAIDEVQAEALKTRLAVPMFYGVDAVHGHNNIEGAVVFPHNIGLGATRNARLVEEAGVITAREVAGAGAHWAFAPCVATAQNIRWGRTYESFSDDPELAGRLGAAAVRGIQAPLPGGFRVLACSKH
jgi:beta-glucosidase